MGAGLQRWWKGSAVEQFQDRCAREFVRLHSEWAERKRGELHALHRENEDVSSAADLVWAMLVDVRGEYTRQREALMFAFGVPGSWGWRVSL